jgi:predicted amidohydrolase YtcJ
MHHPLIALLLPAVLGAQQPAFVPDLILTNGRIFTSDSTRPWAEALAIHGERIVAVGSAAEVKAIAHSGTRTIDLGGRLVIPGLNDAHIHVSLGWPGARIAVPGNPFPNPDRAVIADSLRAAVQRVPEGTWISVDIGPVILFDSLARRPWLDSLAPRHPVRLAAYTGHGTVYNSAAFGVLGVDESVKDPIGGWYDRRPDGTLTGLVQGYAQYAVPQVQPGTAPADMIKAYHDGLAGAAGLGLTTLQNMEATEPELSAQLFSSPDLPVRIRVMSFIHTTPSGRRLGRYASPGRPDSIGPHAYAAGDKYILDGTPMEQGALMRRPYAGRPGWYGRLIFPVDTIRAILREAVESADQLMLHVVGDSTIALVLRLMTETAPDSAWQAHRVRFEHADMLAPDLLPLVRRLGIVVVQNPSHLIMGPRIGAQYGAELARWIQPVRTLIDAGIPLALGSDGPLNPFLNLMLAVTNPHRSEAITLEQAVLAYTIGAAYAERMEQERGMLAPGLLADLAVLSQDIFSVPLETLPGTTSVLTLVGGRTVHDAGALR